MHIKRKGDVEIESCVLLVDLSVGLLKHGVDGGNEEALQMQEENKLV